MVAVFGVDFLVVVDFLVDFFGAGFAVSSLARRARRDLRREAVFFFRRPFFTALSYSLWIFFILSGVRSDLKVFKASLMDFLISWFFWLRFTAWRAAFLADLIIGIRGFL